HQDPAPGQRILANLKRVHQQRSQALLRQLGVDLMILDDPLTAPKAVEKVAQPGVIETALVNRVKLPAHGLLGLDQKGVVEGGICGDDAESLVEHDKRLADRIDDA